MESRWEEIEEAVSLAIEIPLNERAAWLERYCQGDQTLRAEVDSLLNSEIAAQHFLEHSIAPYAGTLLEDEFTSAAPVTVGPYRICREIGRGGMGVV